MKTKLKLRSLLVRKQGEQMVEIHCLRSVQILSGPSVPAFSTNGVQGIPPHRNGIILRFLFLKFPSGFSEAEI